MEEGEGEMEEREEMEEGEGEVEDGREEEWKGKGRKGEERK